MSDEKKQDYGEPWELVVLEPDDLLTAGKKCNGIYDANGKLIIKLTDIPMQRKVFMDCVNALIMNEPPPKKFRKACANFGKVIAEKIKPMAKRLNDLLLRSITRSDSMTEIKIEDMDAAWDCGVINVGDILVFGMGEKRIVTKVGDKWITTRDITPWYRRAYNWGRRLFL